MKKLIYLIFIPLLMGMGCSDDDEQDTIIPTTDYVLGENYSWKNLEKDKVYCIDSEVDLLKLVEGEGEIVKVDFEKSTLILVVVEIPSIGYKTNHKLRKSPNTDYLLELIMEEEVILLPSFSVYYICLKSEKIEQNASIKYTVKLPN